MSTSAFEQGAAFTIEGRPHQLVRKLEQEIWQLEESRTKRITEISEGELRKLYLEGKLKFGAAPEPVTPEPKGATTLVDYAPEQWERAKIRRAYVMATLDIPSYRPRIITVIQQTWERLREPKRIPNAATVIRWKTRFIKAGRDITALIEQNDRKGNFKSRYPLEVQDIVEHAISARYLTLERATIEDTLHKAMADVERENSLRPQAARLPLPTRRLVDRLIKTVPAFDRCAARYGRTVAARRFRSVLGHRTTQAPLERAEMDHTRLDLLVIDDATCLPLGRPWLTGCLDDYSRNALGVYLGFEPPSYFTVARCLRQAILPKVWLKDEYPAIKNAWAAHGVMRELVVDNGTEFHSASLENACYSLGIEIHYSPRKTPWFKGKIERYLGTLNRAIAHRAPGTTFGNILEKDEYDPSKHAVVRYSVLKEILYTWIVDVYHQAPHRALGLPPGIMWAKSISSEQILVPDDPARFDAILGRSEVRSLSHKGIELDGLFYNSPDLTALRRKLGERIDVEIRIDAADIGKITVLSPDRREFYSVPALRSDYADGLSTWQHRVCRRYAARELSACSPTAWRQAKERIAELIEAEFLHRKRKTRTRVARFRHAEPSVGRQESARPGTEHMDKPPCESAADPVAGRSGAIEAPLTSAPVSSESVDESPTEPEPRKRFRPIYRERGGLSVKGGDTEE